MKNNNYENYTVQARRENKSAGLLFFLMMCFYIGVSLTCSPLFNDVRVNLLITQLILILFPIIIYLIIKKKNIFSYIRFRKMNIWSAFLVVIMTVALIPLFSLLNCISMLFTTNVISNSMTELLENNSYYVILALVALMPAIVEETTYRGVFYNTFRGARPLKAIFLSAFMFGAMHMNFNQFSYAFVMGIVMGFLVEATDSIIASMLMHFTFNGTSTTLSYIAYEYSSSVNSEQVKQTVSTHEELLRSVVVLLPFALIGIVIAGALYIAIAYLNGRLGYVASWFKGEYKTERMSYPKPKLISIWLVLGLCCCLAIALLQEIVLRYA